jgi:hypothetical protein
MKELKSIILILFLLLITTACTPVVSKYRVTIDAISSPNTLVKPSSYTIKALGKDTDTNSLRFQRQSQYLVKLLNKKGYIQNSSENLAEEIIYFDYGIEKLKEERSTYSEPDISFGVSWGYPFGYYHHRYHPFWHNVSYTSYRSYSRTYRLFNRYITILAKDKIGKELWRVDASSVGESDNLNKIIPLLIEAIEPYIGTDTDKPVHIVVEEERKSKTKSNR